MLLSDCIFSYSGTKVINVSKDSFQIDDVLETKLDDGIGISFLLVKIKTKVINLIVKKRVLKRSILELSLIGGLFP